MTISNDMCVYRPQNPTHVFDHQAPFMRPLEAVGAARSTSRLEGMKWSELLDPDQLSRWISDREDFGLRICSRCSFALELAGAVQAVLLAFENRVSGA